MFTKILSLAKATRLTRIGKLDCQRKVDREHCAIRRKMIVGINKRISQAAARGGRITGYTYPIGSSKAVIESVLNGYVREGYCVKTPNPNNHYYREFSW